MSCEGPWKWDEIKTRLILGVVGYNKGSNVLDYSLHFYKAGEKEEDQGTFAMPLTMYILKRTPLLVKQFVDPIKNTIHYRPSSMYKKTHNLYTHHLYTHHRSQDPDRHRLKGLHP